MTAEIIPLLILAFAFGVALGAAGYRAMLKRDPERLEKWAKQIKEAGDDL